MKKYLTKTSLLVIVVFLFNAANFHSADVYQIDAGHTFIQFSVERFGMVDVSGYFRDVSGVIQYDPAVPNAIQAEIIIETASLDSGHEIRDGHLKGEIWLNTAKYPEIKFSTTKVTLDGQKGDAIGDLTIRGVTKEVAFPFEMKGPFTDPTKNTTIAITGSLIVDRQDFGLSFSKILDANVPFIGNEVRIDISSLAAIKK